MTQTAQSSMQSILLVVHSQSDIKLWPLKVVYDADNKPVIVVNYQGDERNPHF